MNENDKNEKTLAIVREYVALGFSIIATHGTSEFLAQHGVDNKPVYKVHEGRPHIVDHIKNGEVDLIINTPLGEESRYDEYAIGWAAIQNKVSFITTLSAAATAVKGIERLKQGNLSVRSLQEYHRK